MSVSLITIKEANQLYRIGRDKLYELTNIPKNKFTLFVGEKRLIKKEIFEEYLEKSYKI